MNNNLSFNLRLARPDDALPILKIRNSEAVRNVSFNTEVISEEDHIKWFNNSLQREDRWILVAALESQELIGVLRYDIINPTGLEVSIFLNPEYVGHGIGHNLINKGNIWVQQHMKNIRTIEAKVLSDNVASNKTFIKCGFVEKFKVYKLDI